MNQGDVAVWIGLALTALGMIMGGVIHVNSRFNEAKREAETRVTAVKTELDTRHARDVERVEEQVEDERTERRREIDRIERAVESFGEIAKAVVAMGRSVEHMSDSFHSHQKNYAADQKEIKAAIRAIEERLPVGRTRSRTKET